MVNNITNNKSIVKEGKIELTELTNPANLTNLDEKDEPEELNEQDEISSIEGFIEDNNLKNEINKTNLKESIKMVLKNNYWNDEHDDIMKNLKRFTNFLSREYQQAYWKYRGRLQIYRIPIIVMSSLSGFLSISNSGYIPPAYNKWVSLLVGFVNLMVTVITLIENFKKIDTHMNKSFSAHINFKQLHDEIAIMLKVPSIERSENGNDTISRFFTRYQAYLLDAPVIKKITNNLLECPLESRIIQDIEEKATTSSSTRGLLKKNKSIINSRRSEDLESGVCIKTQILNKLGMVDNNSVLTQSITKIIGNNSNKNIKKTNLETELTKSISSINKAKQKGKKAKNTISSIDSELGGSEEIVNELNDENIINIEFMDKSSPKIGKKLHNIKINEDL